MLITGIPADEFVGIVKAVSDAKYDGNLKLDYSPNLLNQAGTRFRCRVRAVSSREHGARRSWSGRRMPLACWHAMRDIYAETFRRFPNARISTSMADYRGEADFYAQYPVTAFKNIGSLFAPAYMPDLCECSADEEPDYLNHSITPALAPRRVIERRMLTTERDDHSWVDAMRVEFDDEQTDRIIAEIEELLQPTGWEH